MQKVKHIPHYSYNDYKLWKGDWELIEGLPFAMSPSPTAEHQTVALHFVKQIGSFLDRLPCSKECFLFYELDWIVDEETVLRPDVSVVCGAKVSGFIRKAPVLIVEILSESTAYNDRIVKKDIYEAQGVKYYLIADPDKKTMNVFELAGGKYQQVERATFKLVENCELTLRFSEIWE